MENFPRNNPENAQERRAVSYGYSTRASQEHPLQNEDAIILNKDKKCFGVLDGVSGSIKGSGSIASETAKQVFDKILAGFPEQVPTELAQNYLKDAFVAAHQRVKEVSTEGEGLQGMATTASVVKILESVGNKRQAIICNIGDSRVYLYRRGQLRQITIDDSGIPFSYQEELNNATDDSFLSAEGKVYFRQRNKINKAIGSDNLKPNLYVLDLNDGDRLIITSDGIHDNLSSPEIAQYFDGMNFTDQQLADQLVQAASAAATSKADNFRGKHDDMSAIVVSVSGDAKMEQKKKFEGGDIVNVRRSNGVIESGWQIALIDKATTAVYVRKGNLQKEVTERELREWNS